MNSGGFIVLAMSLDPDYRLKNSRCYIWGSYIPWRQSASHKAQDGGGKEERREEKVKNANISRRD